MNWIHRIFRRLFPERANWHVTHVSSDAQFNCYGATYREALREMRERFPGARVVTVDLEWHVILFRG